jgi:hypothetical protein
VPGLDVTAARINQQFRDDLLAHALCAVKTRPEAELAEIASWRAQPAAQAGPKPRSSPRQACHGTGDA